MNDLLNVGAYECGWVSLWFVIAFLLSDVRFAQPKVGEIVGDSRVGVLLIIICQRNIWTVHNVCMSFIDCDLFAS